MGDQTVVVYLDNALISELADPELDHATVEALGELAEQEGVAWVTSRVTLDEMLETGDSVKRGVLKFLYSLMDVTAYTPPESMVGVGGGFGPIAGGEEEPEFRRLREIFQGRGDVNHVFQAVRSNCDYFLTLDHRTILHNAREHRGDLNEICPDLEFVSPSKLLHAVRRNERE